MTILQPSLYVIHNKSTVYSDHFKNGNYKAIKIECTYVLKTLQDWD